MQAHQKIGKLSVVIPVYNEEQNLEAVHREIAEVLRGYDYEIIWVDDGSQDRSYEILKILSTTEAHLRLIQFRRNYGQSAAMHEGIRRAQGDWIITLDADRQNDPQDIPRLIQRALEENADVVSGWRRNRKDHFLSRVLISRIANQMISWITRVTLHDYGCTLKLYRAEILKQVMLYGELHRFLPALCSWQGARIVEQVVNHRPRIAGKSKYGLERIYKVLFDLLSVKYFLSYNAKPLHFFGSIGLMVMTPGFLTASIISIRRIIWHVDISPRIPTLIFCTLSILAGFQTVMMGLIADLIVRNAHQTAIGSSNRYQIRECVGFK